MPNILQEQENALKPDLKVTETEIIEPINAEKLKLKYSKISKIEHDDLIQELSSSYQTENFAHTLDVEEDKLKSRIEKIKVEKSDLEESIKVSLEESTYTRRIDRDLDKVEQLGRNQEKLEEMLSKTQLKKILVAHVSEVTEKYDNVEDLFEDAWLELPNILEQEDLTKLLATKLQVQTKLHSLDQVGKLIEYYASASKDVIQEFVNELTNHYTERNYANRLESEETQLTAEINEIEVHKAMLESIQDSDENQENLEQIAILEQEESMLTTRLLNNQLKQVAIAKIEVIKQGVEELTEEIFENAVLAVPNILEQEQRRLAKAKKEEIQILSTDESSKYAMH